MAIVSKKSPLYGVSGKIGGVVLRQYKGRTIIAKAPVRRSGFVTAAQLAHQAKFTAMVKAKRKTK